MAGSDRDLVERVKSAVDIVDVAEGYFPLQKRGERFLALCPFHREKTPSFSIHAGRQVFHCFGCGKGGDVLTLVMEMDRLTFPEALHQLATRAGVELPERRRSDPAEGQRVRLLEMMQQAAAFYARCLATPAGAAARNYLEGRGLGRASVEAFGIGYAPDQWRALHDHLGSLGFREEELLRAGLVKRNERGNVWDLLRHRVVLPIRDARGRVIAFGGRVLDDSKPKYVNSPETELFSKRTVLFAFDRARHAAASRGAFVIVEGYMDVIAAHGRGIENVVAALGTAFTRDHVAQLRRYAPRAVLLFDADEGGTRAADRGAAVLLEEGLEVTVATLPPGQDPDDFLRERDGAAFEEWISAHSEDLLSYLIRRAREGHPGDSVTGTAAAAREVLAQVEQVQDDVQLDLYLRRISQEFGIEERLLRREARKRPAAADSGALAPGPPARVRGMLRGWEQDETTVLQAATTDPELARQVVEELSEDDFRDTGRRRVFQVVRDLLGGGQAPIPSRVLERLKDDAAAAVSFERLLGHEPLPGEAPGEALERLRDRRDDHEYRRLREESSRSGLLKSAPDEELDRRLMELARYHATRYERLKGKRAETDGAPS